MGGLDERGIPYEGVPGVSSCRAAAATCKVGLTAPDVSQTVICCRTPGRTPVPAGQDPVSYAPSGATLCCFLSVAGITQLASDLAEHYGDECPVRVVYRASWPDEQIVSGTLADIAGKVGAAGITRQAMIIVGHALERPLKQASLLYARHFTHGYREGQA
jgi:precorrin-4/cobalt-precorrin-4 C11-methyltransferase